MDDDTSKGITLQNTMLLDEPMDEPTTIDWDAVLRDFAGDQTLSPERNTGSSDFLSSLAQTELALFE